METCRERFLLLTVMVDPIDRKSRARSGFVSRLSSLRTEGLEREISMSAEERR